MTHGPDGRGPRPSWHGHLARARKAEAPTDPHERRQRRVVRAM